MNRTVKKLILSLIVIISPISLYYFYWNSEAALFEKLVADNIANIQQNFDREDQGLHIKYSSIKAGGFPNMPSVIIKNPSISIGNKDEFIASYIEIIDDGDDILIKSSKNIYLQTNNNKYILRANIMPRLFFKTEEEIIAEYAITQPKKIILTIDDGVQERPIIFKFYTPNKRYWHKINYKISKFLRKLIDIVEK